MRGDWAFGEEIIRIADNTSSDWSFNPESGKLSVNKEAMLRSKIRIEARQFHMSRLHPQQWGDRQQIDIEGDYALMTEDQRVAKALELIGVIKELAGPKPTPPPLVYVPEEEPEPEPSGIGD